jgi:hypothetical protein
MRNKKIQLSLSPPHRIPQPRRDLLPTLENLANSIKKFAMWGGVLVRVRRVRGKKRNGARGRGTLRTFGRFQTPLSEN